MKSGSAGEDPPRQVLVLSRKTAPSAPALPPSRDSVIAHVVPCADDALRKLDRDVYDVIVCPLEMAGDVPTLLRLHRVAPQTPIVALMPEADRILAELALDSGATEVLSESVWTEGLPLLAEGLIRRSRGLRSANPTLADPMEALLTDSQDLLTRSMPLDGAAVRDLRALVVEDDSNQALLLERTFRKSGLEFALPVMPDGEAAIRYLRGDGEYEHRDRFPMPNLVLLDLHLPRKHGFEVLEWIRSQHCFRELPVFVMTSSVLPEDLDRSLALGADFGFIKPVSLQHLQATLHQIVVRWGRIMQANDSRKARGLP